MHHMRDAKCERTIWFKEISRVQSCDIREIWNNGIRENDFKVVLSDRHYETLIVCRTTKLILISPSNWPFIAVDLYSSNRSNISVELFLPCNLKFAPHNHESALRWNRAKKNGQWIWIIWSVNESWKTGRAAESLPRESFIAWVWPL